MTPSLVGRAVLALSFGLGVSLLAATSAAQDRVFTGRVEVSGLPLTVTSVVVRCRLAVLTRMIREGETSLPTALADDGSRRVSAPFTVTVYGDPTARSYSCQIGFRGAGETRWAANYGPTCRAWHCGAPGTVFMKNGTLP